MTFVLGGLWRSANNLRKNALTLNESAHALQALFPLRRRLLPVRRLLRKSCSPGLPLLLLPSLQVGRLTGGSLGVHLVLCPVRLSLLLLDLGPVRGVEVSLVARLVRASAPLSPQLLRELERGRLLVRSGRPLPAPLLRLPLPAHHSTLCNVVSRERLLWSAPVLDPPVFPDLRIEEQGRIAEPALGRPALVTAPVVLAVALLTARGRERRRRDSSRSLSSHEQSRRDRSRSSDRSRLRRVRSRSRGDWPRSSDCYRSRRDRSRSSYCYRLRRQHSRPPARRGGCRDRSRSRDPPRRFCDRSQSRVRSPPSSERSRSKEGGWRARRERQQGVETVAVSQAPVVSEASATVAPPVGGATVTALPSAVQDPARFFLSLAGSSSFGAVGGVAGAAAPASGVGAQLCPSALCGGAVASCAVTAMPAGAVDSPAASAAVPGSSGRQQRQEVSRSSRRRHCSSNDGTGWTKKRTRDRSPSPGRSSRRREKSYRSSSESSEDDRAIASPPISGRAHEGTPGDSRPVPTGDRSPRPDPSGWRPQSPAGAERYRSGFGGRLSPRLRARRTMTIPVPWFLWTSTGMTLSGLSWPSSGTSTAWKSRQVYHQLDARLLLHRSMG